MLPELTSAKSLEGGVVVVIDVLRATTTIVHALAAGCLSVIPCLDVEEALAQSRGFPRENVILGGERQGKPLPGFDRGNSPGEYTSSNCRSCTLVLTTTNGTRALLQARQAERVLIAAFVNYSAVCEQLRLETRPVHILCAGHAGEIALEDTILAGAFVDFLSQLGSVKLNDSARIAWDCYDLHGAILEGALEVSAGGVLLAGLGYDEDIRQAARVDLYTLVPQMRVDPVRIEVGAVSTGKSYWKKR